VDEKALRQPACVKLKAGERPKEPEARLWGGPALGLPCALCDGTIERGDREYKAEFPAGYTLKAIRFHRLC
jgi:hypothetical protein